MVDDRSLRVRFMPGFNSWVEIDPSPHPMSRMDRKLRSPTNSRTVSARIVMAQRHSLDTSLPVQKGFLPMRPVEGLRPVRQSSFFVCPRGYIDPNTISDFIPALRPSCFTGCNGLTESRGMLPAFRRTDEQGPLIARRTSIPARKPLMRFVFRADRQILRRSG